MLLPFYIAESWTLTDHSEDESLLFSVKDDFPLHVALEYWDTVLYRVLQNIW